MQASRLFPKNIRILSLLALTYLENGDEHKAMEATERLFTALDQVEDKQQEDFESLYRAGQYLFMKGDIDKALQYYKKVLKAVRNALYASSYGNGISGKRRYETFRWALQADISRRIARLSKNAGLSYEGIIERIGSKHIPPEDLVKEFLKNKDNNN